MKAYLILFLLCSCSLFAQEPKVTLYQELHEIKRFEQLDLMQEAEAGETFIVQVQVVGNRPLRYMRIHPPRSPFQLSAKKIYAVGSMRIKAEQSGVYRFSFTNKGLRKRKVFVKIEKELIQRYRDTLILDTVLFSSAMDTFRTTVLDTQRIPDILQKSFVLAPTYQLNAKSSQCYNMTLDEEGLYVAYWIGLGPESLKAYEDLKALPPPSWLLRSVNEPIMAYGLGLTRQLPESPALLGSRLGLSNETVPTKAGQEIGLYGIIRREDLPRLGEQLQFCFKNFSPTSPIQVHLRLARLQLTTREMQKYIRQMQTRERYILKKVPIPPAQ